MTLHCSSGGDELRRHLRLPREWDFSRNARVACATSKTLSIFQSEFFSGNDFIGQKKHFSLNKNNTMSGCILVNSLNHRASKLLRCAYDTVAIESII